jgi:hypothetical protein
MRQFLFTIFGFLYLLSVSVVSATDFSVSFENEYIFTEDGTATVKKKLILTNLTTQNYPSEYYLDLPTDAQNVVAFDEEGETNATVIDENGQKRAKIVFNQESLGFGENITIAFSYDTKTLAINENNRWRIAIPGHASEDIADYTVAVTFPESWGTPQRVIPPPDTPYYWTLSERPESLISIDFEQVKVPTPTPSPTSSAFPIAVGISVGVITVFILFEFLRRT